MRVLFFGLLKEVVGAAEDEVQLPAGSSVADLWAHYGRRFPRLEEYRASVAVAVNQEYTDSSAALQPDDEVAFLPPVSGGAGEDVIAMTRQPIAVGEIVARLKAPPDGAVVVFDGIVRHQSGGKQTLYLEYESYEAMALKRMQEIAAALRARYSIDRVALVHRLGRLEIGETSVLIAVSAPHRAAAFDACRAAIEQLKRTVPIWKKEYFADGAVWVEGETPAPAELTRADS